MKLKSLFFITALFCAGCEEKSDPSDCDYTTTRVVYNGEKHCTDISGSEVKNVNQPGYQAFMSFDVFKKYKRDNIVLLLEIDLPETGAELNKPYTITQAWIRDEKRIERGSVKEGTIVFTQFSSTLWAGTYSVTVVDGSLEYVFTNGDFNGKYLNR
jgi:hypothetical protein